jgi:hypothetical protein
MNASNTTLACALGTGIPAVSWDNAGLFAPCTCSAPYSGPTCSVVDVVWFYVQFGVRLTEAIGLAMILTWSGVVLCIRGREGHLKSLTSAALVMQLIAILSQAAFLVTPSAELIPFYSNLWSYYLASTLRALAISAWMISSAMSTAAWYRKMRAPVDASYPPLANAVATVVWLFVVFLGLSSAAFSIPYIVPNVFWGALADIVVLLTFVGLMGALVLRTVLLSVSRGSRRKHVWGSCFLAALVYAWVIYCLMLESYRESGSLSWIHIVSFRLIDILVAILIAVLADYRFRIITRAWFGRRPVHRGVAPISKDDESPVGSHEELTPSSSEEDDEATSSA